MLLAFDPHRSNLLKLNMDGLFMPFLPISCCTLEPALCLMCVSAQPHKREEVWLKKCIQSGAVAPR